MNFDEESLPRSYTLLKTKSGSNCISSRVLVDASLVLLVLSIGWRGVYVLSSWRCGLRVDLPIDLQLQENGHQELSGVCVCFFSWISREGKWRCLWYGEWNGLEWWVPPSNTWGIENVVSSLDDTTNMISL